jgi:hypothetical protein
MSLKGSPQEGLFAGGPIKEDLRVIQFMEALIRKLKREACSLQILMDVSEPWAERISAPIKADRATFSDGRYFIQRGRRA